MKKISIGIYLTLVFIGTYFVLPPSTFAQGTFGCKREGSKCITDPTKTACDANYYPSDECKRFIGNLYGVCASISIPCVANSNANSDIIFCVPGDQDSGVSTAIGCMFAKEPLKLIGQILGWATILGAGIAFLLVIFGGFQITTAAGDPKRVKAAQELITAAIMGLLLIIFSIFLLNLIGIKILNLPDFLTPNP